MSIPSTPPATPVSTSSSIPWRRPMTGRDPHEDHRASTPLELFFDLCFVVAVAAAAATLHHDLAEGHWSGLAGYLMVFFALWWAWMNYSWFASAYDTGDVVFRLLTFVVMTGVLVLAAGTPLAAGGTHDFGLVVVGYVIMRLAMIPLWLRVAREHPASRSTALRYAGATAVIQVLWILRTLFLPHGTLGYVSFLVLAVLEMATPYVAERTASATPWHRHHIAERYELFTIIVLGEVILASTDAIAGTVDGLDTDPQLLLLVLGALLLVFSMWWVYFKRPMVDSLDARTSYAFGYAHFLVFASAAAVGAGLAVLVEVADHEAHVGTRPAVLLLVGAVSVYLLSIAGVHSLAHASLALAVPALVVVAVLLVVGSLGLPAGTSVLLVGLTVAASLADHLRRDTRAGRRSVSG